MPSPRACGLIYIFISGLMLIPSFVPWAAVPISSPTVSPTLSPTFVPTTSRPTTAFTHVPSSRPSLRPSSLPSTLQPSNQPTTSPTTSRPSRSPTTSRPSASPSSTTIAPTTLRPSTGSPSTETPTVAHPSSSPIPAIPANGTRSPTTPQPTVLNATSSPSLQRAGRLLSGQTITMTKNFMADHTDAFLETTPISFRRHLESYSNDVRLVWLLWLWPCLSYFFMGVAYLLNDSRDVTTHRSFGMIILGKELDGSMKWYALILMFPVLLPLWIIWYVRHSYTRRKEHPFDEIVPGVYLGRYPLRPWRSKWTPQETFPPMAMTIVDLIAEMPVPRSVYKGRMYYCLPTLDMCAPNVEALREVGSALASMESTTSAQGGSQAGSGHFRRLESAEDLQGEGLRMKGSVFVFCANGRGRSATLVMVVLVMRGHCQSVEEALEIIKRVRPQVHPQEHQMQAAREAINSWRSSQKTLSPVPVRQLVPPSTNQDLTHATDETDSADRRGRKRTLSHADEVSDKDLDFFLVSTDSTNVIKVPSGPGPSSAVKRTFSEKTREEKEPILTLIQPGKHEENVMELHLVRDDLIDMARRVLKVGDKETGGDLFGIFGYETIVHHVIGSGPHALVTTNAFVQDEEYLKRANRLLGELTHLGEWHSHHDFNTPSKGDVETIFTKLERTGNIAQLLVILNCLSNDEEVEVAAYIFQSTSIATRKYTPLLIKIIPSKAIPNYGAKKAELENLVLSNFSDQQPVFLKDPEDPRDRGEPLPQPNLQSTESKNIIDLSLQ